MNKFLHIKFIKHNWRYVVMRELLREYDDMIIGKRDSFSDRFFRKDSKENERNALFVMKYAFEKYLRMKPDALEQLLDRELMEKMHLTSLMRFIKFPPEYSKTKDYFYLTTLIYEQFSLSFRDRTIHMYENVLSGKLSKYPKDYFTGSEGMVRAGICLQHMINHHMIAKNMNDLYHFFATQEGYEKLQEEKLLKVCRELFETPVDYLNFTLSADLSDQYLFMYYKYCFLTEMINEKGRKRASEADYKLKIEDAVQSF